MNRQCEVFHNDMELWNWLWNEYDKLIVVGFEHGKLLARHPLGGLTLNRKRD